MVQTRIVQLVDKDLYVDVSEDSLEIQTAGKTRLKNTIWVHDREFYCWDSGLGNQGYC